MPRHKANGEGSIIKLDSGKYKGIMTVEIIRDKNNKIIKQKRQTFTHEKRSEVQKWLNKLINDKQNNTLLINDKTTVEQWLNLWIDKYKKNTFTTRTYEEYKTLIKVHLIPSIGKIELQKLKTSDLQTLYTEKIKDGKSPQTVKHIHVCINGALKQAIKERIIMNNPASNCELPKIERKQIDTLNSKEIKKLLESNKDHHLYPLLLLELGTGLRRAELLALKWHNIDLDNGILYVEGNISETKKGVIYQTTPKTKSSVRSVSLPDSVITELKSYQKKAKNNSDDIVFPNHKGKYMRPSTLTQIFKYTWLHNAGLSQRSFHSLRHTHATMLLAQNVHAKIVQQRLGHANISTTLDIYSHALPDMQKDAAIKINKVLQL